MAGGTVNKVVNYVWKSTGAEGVTDGMKKLALQAALVAIAYKTVTAAQDFLVSSTRAAVDANEDMNKFLVVMGDNAHTVNQELETLADTTNRNVFELRALSAGLQDMLVPMGVDRELASGLSSDFTRLAIDLSSFNNVPVGEVMNALKSGLAGLSRPMRNFGVDLRQATVDQELLNMGVLGGYDAATTAERAIAVYNLTVRQSADAQGDAARTADEAANLLVGFSAKVDEAKVKIGDKFLPVIEQLIPRLEELGAEVFPLIMESFSEVADTLLKYGPDIIEVISSLIEAIQWLHQAAEDLSTVSRVFHGVGSLGISEASRGIDELVEAQQVLRENTEFLSGLPIIPTQAQERVSISDILTGLTGIASRAVNAGNSLLTMAQDYEQAQGTIAGAGPLLTAKDLMPEDLDAAKLAETLELARELRIQAAAEAVTIEESRIGKIEELELASFEERAAATRLLADETAGFITTAFLDSWDSALDGAKRFLAQVAEEFAASQLLGLLGAGAKGATGGVGGFLLDMF